MSTILKCKMCGGDIEISADMTVGTCQYCGSSMTFPKIDTDKKARLFNLANQFRLNCDFDRAIDAYKALIQEDTTEAEAYWGLILSECGVEYVVDPSTGKRIPTCHRTVLQSITESVNFQRAVENADLERKFMYQEEADRLEKLQRRIIAVSKEVEPYDIFICYKESDDNGERTLDSVLAQDIYDALRKEGYRVFFSRISLEDKLGVDYEPYIYGALNSAKVMLAVGTNTDNYEATWVKNEWSRFIKMIENGEDKVIIPCYKGISPYELPKTFERYQAQDMGKVGAIQDLLRGIEKIVRAGANSVSDQFGNLQGKSLVNNVVQRGDKFLAAKEWSKAAEAYNQAINLNEGCAEAYLGLLLAAKHVLNVDDLSGLQRSLENDELFINALRSADENVKKKLLNANEQIKDKNARQATKTKNILKKSGKIVAIAAALLLLVIGANKFYTHVLDPAMKYKKALNAYEAEDYELAINYFSELNGYKDSGYFEMFSRAQLAVASGKPDEAVKILDTIKDDEEARILKENLQETLDTQAKELSKKLQEEKCEINYKNGVEFLKSKKYEDAMAAFETDLDYQDSRELYEQAKNGFTEQTYENAARLWVHKQSDALGFLVKIRGYKDVDSMIDEIAPYAYAEAEKAEKDGAHARAQALFTVLGSIGYKDSEQKINDVADMELLEAKLKEINGRWNWKVYPNYVMSCNSGKLRFGKSVYECDKSNDITYTYDKTSASYKTNFSNVRTMKLDEDGKMLRFFDADGKGVGYAEKK